MPVLFFDIGATLADGRLEADGSLTLLPRPRVVAVLDSLREVPKGAFVADELGPVFKRILPRAGRTRD
jgi:hypothetical protein